MTASAQPDGSWRTQALLFESIPVISLESLVSDLYFGTADNDRIDLYE